MTTENEKFNDYKLIHNFNYPNEPLKSWITQDNYTNLYTDDWNELMPVVEKIDQIGASVIIGRMFCEIKYINPLNQSQHFEVRIASGVKINAINGAVIDFIKWYNNQ
jgi:hypothetical protein